jgi:hypothetical protein
MPDADVNTAAKHIVSEAQRAMNAARKVLADTFFTLTQRLNQARRHVVYNIRDEGMISTRNLKLPIGSSRAKKFTSRVSVPFTVTDIVANGLAYTNKLLTHMGLHLTFHAGLLKPNLRGSRINRDARPLNPTSSRTATKNGKWKPSSITAARAAGENQPTSLSGVVSQS